MVRQMFTNGDSLLYGGNSISDKNYTRNFTLEYNSNSVLFLYSAPQYETPGGLSYSYILEGFDKKWSDWSLNNEKEYTNLPEGDYIFKVKAKNIYGFESAEDKVILTVLPPWYQSLGAYLIYVVLGILMITIIVLYIIRKFEKERKTLQDKQKNELSIREQEYERESLKAEQEIIKLRNEKLTIENQKKQSEIENKTKELASIAMQITYKNEMLTKVRQKLTKVSQKMIHQESKQQVDGLIKTLEKDMVRDDDWERFELSFDQVHEDFLKKLRTRYSELSPKDLRLCAYLRMNLSSKEIAPLLNISIRGVEISRYRLRRKLNIDRETNLTEFMMNL
jgi:DNA-binding CsgD family transcriptional regulator